jgi:hypothetical protein
LAGSAEIGEHAAIVLTFNQSQQEEIDGRFRLYGAKVRRKQDHGTIVGHIDRARCRITTEGWLNSANSLVSGRYEGQSIEAVDEAAGRAAMKARVIPRRAPAIIEPKRFHRPAPTISKPTTRPKPTITPGVAA